MLKKWIMPEVDNRIEEVVSQIENNHLMQELRKNYFKLFNDLTSVTPVEQRELLYSLDTIKNDIVQSVVDQAYKHGFNDAIEVYRGIDNLKL